MQKLTDALRKQIFGQDAAINLLSSLLQNACIKLYDKAGPLCSFLLAGPHDTGKTAIAQAIAEYLVGTQDAVLKIDLNHPAGHSLQTIPILHKQHKHLVAAIQHMPYAIVLIEDIDQLPPNAITLIKQIFLHKNLFKHSIIIATTRLSNEKMQPAYPAENKNVDLMQILLNDNNNQQVTEFSLQELRDEMFPKLSEHLTADLLQHFNIIPLLPLDYAALEKIVRNKIKALSRHLHDKFGIELTCAPETIKFLAQEASWRNITSKSLDNLFEQHLYSTVMHQLLMQAENKDRSKRLLIQVNDSGTLLRCEFIAANEAALYSL